MNIVAATQQFAVHEHRVMQSGQLNNSVTKPWQPAAVAAQTSAEPGPVAEPRLTAPAIAADHNNQVPAAESTASEPQIEDEQPFNALQSVGAVKRILQQLSSGKLLSWLDGTAVEKILAQNSALQQRKAQASGTPAVAAQATAAEGGPVTQWNYRYQSIDAELSGNLQLEDGSALRWSVHWSQQEEQFTYRQISPEQMQDPLVLSLNGTATQLKSTGTLLDFYGDGREVKLADLASGQYYLMRDLNQNQQLDSGLELFGPQTGQGFTELAQLDDNQNGFIEATDSQWQQLRLWSGSSGSQTLAAHNIAAISAQSVATSFGLYQGEALLGRIVRTGIFLTQPELGELSAAKPPGFGVGLIQQVDLNI